MGKNTHVDFGASEDEVLVWSDFAACVKAWCLTTGRAVEIRDPKFSGKDGRGWGFRLGKRDVLALLCRASGIDILLLLAAKTYQVLQRIELPTTDATNIAWSPDGRWIAVWESPSAGYNLHIYTADGHLYRSIAREACDEGTGIQGLGIKTVSWLPGNEKLAIGGWDRRIRILSTRTFAPLVFLDHADEINVPGAHVWSEHVDAQGTRSYQPTPQPATPPKAVLDKNESSFMKTGIGLMSFNADSTLAATREDSTPSTIWIWDLRKLKTVAVLIHCKSVKTLQWCAGGLLLVQTALEGPVVYLYSYDADGDMSIRAQAPRILDLSTHISPAPAAKYRLQYLCSAPASKKPLFLLAHNTAYIFVWPHGKDAIFRFEEDEGEGGDRSEDSLFDILTGRTPVPRLKDVEYEEADEQGEEIGDEGGLEDTFRGKMGRGGGRGGLGDSGVEEMF